MSLSYGLYSVESDVVVISVSGVVTGPCAIDLINALAENKTLSASTRRLWDFLEIADVVLEPGDVSAVRKALDDRFAPLRGRAAVVVKSSIYERGAHLVRPFTDARQTEFFTDTGEALRWLRRKE